LKTGLVKNANSTWLNGRPLDADLSAAAETPAALRQRRELLRAVEASDGAAAGALASSA
jgi:fructokinase